MFVSRVQNFSLYGAPLLGASIGDLLPPPWEWQEAPPWGASAAIGALSNTSKQVIFIRYQLLCNCSLESPSSELPK